MAESLLIIVTLGLMVASLLLLLLPIMPVSAMEWALAMLFGVLTGFSRLTPAAALVISGLMIVGATAGIWMPLLGLRGKQLSCMGLIGFFAGTIAGQLLIPIPFVGMMIGGVSAVIAIEYLQNAQWREAVTSGGSALKLMIYGMMVEAALSIAIIGVVVVSVVTTG